MSFMDLITITISGIAMIIIISMIYNKLKYGTIWLPEERSEKKEMAK